MKLRFKKLNDRAVIPTYGSACSAGADLYSAEDGDALIPPGAAQLIHTGIACEIPDGYVGLIFARSGLAAKRGLAPSNKVGVIDSDYRGELMISLFNQSDSEQIVEAGERIAQLVIVPYLRAEFEEAAELSDTERGDGGFGSTGTK